MPEQSSNHLERKEKQSERVDLVLWGIMVVGADDLIVELERGCQSSPSKELERRKAPADPNRSKKL